MPSSGNVSFKFDVVSAGEQALFVGVAPKGLKMDQMGEGFAVEIVKDWEGVMAFCVDMATLSYEMVHIEDGGVVASGNIPDKLRNKELYPVAWLRSYPDSEKHKKASICFV